MAAAIVLINGGKSTIAKLQAIFPDATMGLAYREGLSASYDEKTGIAHDFPSLEAFMAEYAPDWRPGDPLVLLGFSAGAWTLRYYLRDPAARELISAAIFLDGLYGSADGSSLHSAYDGVLEFARMAQADPQRHRLVMTYHGTPGPGALAPGIYSNLIADAVDGGNGPGVFARGYPNSDHGSQQGIVGPAISEELIAPWLSGVPGAARSWGGKAFALGAIAILAGVAIAKRPWAFG